MNSRCSSSNAASNSDNVILLGSFDPSDDDLYVLDCWSIDIPFKSMKSEYPEANYLEQIYGEKNLPGFYKLGMDSKNTVY